MRTTKSLIAVANELLKEPKKPTYAYQLHQRTGIQLSNIYPMINRLLEAGWIKQKGKPIPGLAGRPPRKMYELTPLGKTELAKIVEP